MVDRDGLQSSGESTVSPPTVPNITISLFHTLKTFLTTVLTITFTGTIQPLILKRVWFLHPQYQTAPQPQFTLIKTLLPTLCVNNSNISIIKVMGPLNHNYLRYG